MKRENVNESNETSKKPCTDQSNETLSEQQVLEKKLSERIRFKKKLSMVYNLKHFSFNSKSSL